MIQRIQSILLLLAALINFSVLLLPLGSASNDDSMEGYQAKLSGSCYQVVHLDELTADFVEESFGFSDDVLLALHISLVVLASVFLLVLIFLYQERQRQVKLGYVGLVMVMVQILVGIFLFMKLPGWVGEGSEIGHDPSFGLFVPVLPLLLVWLAIRRIQKDDQLVRDMDRIR